MKHHEPGPLSRDALLNLLTKHGEKMSEEELERCFEALVGDPSIHRVLEDEVDALDFAHNVLGLADEDMDAEEEGVGANSSGEAAGGSMDMGNEWGATASAALSAGATLAT